MCFPTGAEVLRGHFFVRQEEDLSLHSYYLGKGKAAVVYAATARFIRPDFQCRPKDDREVTELSFSTFFNRLLSFIIEQS